MRILNHHFSRFAKSRWIAIIGVITFGLVLTSVVIGVASTGQGVSYAEVNLFPFIPSPMVFHIVDGVSQADVYSYTGNLTGVRPIRIGGTLFTLSTRNMAYYDPYVLKATQYVYEFMQAQGLAVDYQDWYDEDEDMSGRNVVGELTGTVHPDEIILVTAHLDNMPAGNPAPGADDNASGSVGVMLAAELLAGHEFERTIRFVFFTGEEIDLLGSWYYAEESKNGGENILAVYNMDMIGWDANQDGEVLLETRTKTNAGYPSDLAISGVFTQAVRTYGLSNSIHPVVDAIYDDGIDSWCFWNFNYPSITAIEDFGDHETNPYYHTINDNLSSLNFAYFTNFVKASVATAAHLAIPTDHIIFLPLAVKH